MDVNDIYRTFLPKHQKIYILNKKPTGLYPKSIQYWDPK